MAKVFYEVSMSWVKKLILLLGGLCSSVTHSTLTYRTSDQSLNPLGGEEAVEEANKLLIAVLFSKYRMIKLAHGAERIFHPHPQSFSRISYLSAIFHFICSRFPHFLIEISSPLPSSSSSSHVFTWFPSFHPSLFLPLLASPLSSSSLIIPPLTFWRLTIADI